MRRIVLLMGLAVVVDGCGGARAPMLASRKRPAAAPFAGIQVLAPGPFSGAQFAHFGVNPTVETQEQPVATFGVVTDTASFGLVQGMLARGTLPPVSAIRVEEFVNALAYDEPAPTTGLFVVYADLFPSPQRAGYHLLRLALRAATRTEAPTTLVVVADQSASGAALTRILAPKQTFKSDAFQTISEQLPTRSHVVLIGDGRQLGARDQQAAERLVAAGHALTVVGVGLDRVNEIALHRLARVGGSYHFLASEHHADALARRLKGTGEPVARDTRLQVIFNAKRVARYRLLGHEGRRMAADRFRTRKHLGGTIAPGATAGAIFELKLHEGAGSLGTLRAHYLAPGGARRSIEAALNPLPAATFAVASPAARLAAIAAGFAEKLRQAYWARGLEYAVLEAQLAALPAAVRSHPDTQVLLGLIRKARAIDGRADPYRDLVPLAKMAFDNVPVIR